MPLRSQRRIVGRADTFAYRALAREGIDQTSNADNRKLCAAELFRRLHLDPTTEGFADDHLTLIAHVVGREE